MNTQDNISDGVKMACARIQDPDAAIVGVISGNSVNWEYLENDLMNGIDLHFLEWELNNPDADPEDYQDADGGSLLLGAWLIDTEGRYYPDPSGEYSIIYNPDNLTLQIVRSKTLAFSALCSPCYPGQGDLDQPGEYMTYSLPEEAIRK